MAVQDPPEDVPQKALRATLLVDKANQLEDIDWSEVPGVSASAASMFVAEMRDAADQLREEAYEDEGGEA